MVRIYYLCSVTSIRVIDKCKARENNKWYVLFFLSKPFLENNMHIKQLNGKYVDFCKSVAPPYICTHRERVIMMREWQSHSNK